MTTALWPPLAITGGETEGPPGAQHSWSRQSRPHSQPTAWLRLWPVLGERRHRWEQRADDSEDHQGDNTRWSTGWHLIPPDGCWWPTVPGKRWSCKELDHYQEAQARCHHHQWSWQSGSAPCEYTSTVHWPKVVGFHCKLKRGELKSWVLLSTWSFPLHLFKFSSPLEF